MTTELPRACHQPTDDNTCLPPSISGSMHAPARHKLCSQSRLALALGLVDIAKNLELTTQGAVYGTPPCSHNHRLRIQIMRTVYRTPPIECHHTLKNPRLIWQTLLADLEATTW